MTNVRPTPDLASKQDDSDADAFAVLFLLVIVAATIVYYISH
ncbi:MAG: hypothetical protein WCI66_09575 [Gammaproteobacteria bacterium]